MLEPFVVEVWGKPAGIVIKEGELFCFHAVSRPFFELDGTMFNTPGHARLAAARLGSDDHGSPDHESGAGVSLGKASH